MDPAGDPVQLLPAEFRLRRQHQMGVGGRLLVHVQLVVVREPQARFRLEGRARLGDEPSPEVVVVGRLHRDVRSHFRF